MKKTRVQRFYPFPYLPMQETAAAPDSSPVVFIQHAARRKVGGQGMMGRAKRRRRLGNPVFKMTDELMGDGGDMVNLMKNQAASVAVI